MTISFEVDVHLQTPLEEMAAGWGIIFEFKHCPGPPGTFIMASVPLAFTTVNRLCRARLHGRAGRLTAQNGGLPARADKPKAKKNSVRCWCLIEREHLAAGASLPAFHTNPYSVCEF
jgi:hypothetical protein